MIDLISKYGEENPERFNDEFLTSRKRQDIISAVTEIFKSFEIIDEIKLESVTLETDEASFGPIKIQREYFKPILPSRIERIRYRFKITPTDTDESFIKEGDLYLPKLVDDYYYINEGVRYFLIHQIVDNATYSNKDSVSLKSLFMPLTVNNGTLKVTPRYSETELELPYYRILLFKKCLSPFFYIILGKCLDLLETMPVSNPDNIIIERMNYRSNEIITYINDFFHTDLIFDDDVTKLETEGRMIFQSQGIDANGVYFSISKDIFESSVLAQFLVATLCELRTDYYKLDKNKRYAITYDNLTSPWFWVERISEFFNKTAEPTKRYEKAQAIRLSLERLIDESTKKILRFSEDDKKDSISVIRYILKNFEALNKEDNCNLDTKRVRILEYLLYPLRAYASNQIYRILNSPNRNRAVLTKLFTGLNPMYLIKNIVQNELLRYYNASNDAMTLYSAATKYSMKGPQALSSFVHTEQRDVHPSYTGRLSLVASNAATPGLSGTIVPFVELYDDFFAKPKDE